MQAIIDFDPTKLRRARKDLQVAHPGTAAAPRPLEDGAAARLRQRVAGAAADPAAIDRLGRELTLREVRCVIGGIERWEELREACVVIVRLRLASGLLPPLWLAWQRQPLLAPLQDLLLEAGGGFGWREVVTTPYLSAVEAWVTDPQRAIRIWLDDQGLSCSDIGGLIDAPLRTDTALTTVVRKSVMTEGSLSQLRSEAEHLADWQVELAPEEQVGFGQNYLSTVPPAEWQEIVLDRVRDAYGLPRRPKVPRFWKPVPREAMDAFQRRYIESRIREELGHDGDRERFWLRWADRIVDVEHGRAGDVGYAVLDFDRFVVFEFFETGNAAYFYKPADAAKVRAVRARAPADLKQKHHYRIGRGDNRLIHNPAHAWHSKGDRMVGLWLKSLRGSS